MNTLFKENTYYDIVIKGSNYFVNCCLFKDGVFWINAQSHIDPEVIINFRESEEIPF